MIFDLKRSLPEAYTVLYWKFHKTISNLYMPEASLKFPLLKEAPTTRTLLGVPGFSTYQHALSSFEF